MEQKDKELLLQDLCARLPYRPIVKCKIANLREEQYAKDNHPSHVVHPTYEGNGYLYSVNILSQSVGIRPILKHLEYKEQVYFEKICNDGYINIEDVKPYLRPMSSMTEEEKFELKQEHVKDQQLFAEVIAVLNNTEMRGKVIPHFAADWCDKNMFDYRGLINKDLAIEVTEENNPYVED